MLVPVSGLVQVGSQAMADRYTYLPLVGLSVAVAWGAGRAVRGAGAPRVALAAAAVLSVVAFAALARVQIAVWRDDETLYTHALEIDSRNWMAANALAGVLLERGATGRALELIERALRERPAFAEARLNFGNALHRAGRPLEAVEQYRQALRIHPALPQAAANLGAALAALGRRQPIAPTSSPTFQTSETGLT